MKAEQSLFANLQPTGYNTKEGTIKKGGENKPKFGANHKVK